MSDGMQEAISLLEKAALAKPEDPVIRHKLTHALAKSGRFSEALKSIVCAVSAQPEWTQFHYELVATLTDAGYGPKMQNAIKELAAREADNINALYVLGMSYQTLGNQGEAVASYRKGLERDPTNAVLYYNLGNALKLEGDEEACIRSQHRAIVHSSTLAEPHYVLGVLYMKTMKLAEARKHFETFLLLGRPYLESYLDQARFSLSILGGCLPSE